MREKERTLDVTWMERPVFRTDQRLTPERLNRIHAHHATRLAQVLLGVVGPGVVYGYEIELDEEYRCKVVNDRIYIGCGLAIDCYGRQLFWPGGWIGIEDLCGDPPDCAGPFHLAAHYAERRLKGEDRCGCDDTDAEWVREGVVFTLTRHCRKVDHPRPDLSNHCVDLTDYVCGRAGSGGRVPVDEPAGKLCHTPGTPSSPCCDDWLYDADAGVPLACLEICDRSKDRGEDCDPRFGFCPEKPDVCEYRTHVYRNRLLFELIRGDHLDLARVKGLDFEEWLERDWDDPVPWDDFADKIVDGLRVRFTKPIRTSTLTEASVFVTAIVREQDSFFHDVLRLPVEKLQPLDESGGFSGGVKLTFPDVWIKNQIVTELSRFNFGAIIEFTVRCSLLRDRCGSMPDGRPLDIAPDKPGQAMPGDDFVVAFCVADKPRTQHKSAR